MADSNPDVVDTAAEPSQPTKTVGMADAPSSSTASEAMEPPVSTHVCAFCACGENSLLGQGPLNRYEATPGFNPFKRVLQKSRRCAGDEEKGGREKSPKHPTWRRPRGVSKGSRERSRSPRQLMSTEKELAASLGSDELANIGHPDDVDVGRVFEATGHVWAHEACAAWSEGVQTSVDKLQFVDRAVFTGLSQKCNFCKRYGASIVCKAQHCGKTFHYPCAAASGCFQDIKSLSLLCPNHVDQAEMTAPSAAFCVICSGGTHIGQLLFCTTCGQHFHGSCLSPEVEVKPVLRAGWQCPNCKVCQSCRQKNVQHLVTGRAGDDNKMLVCDTCDKGYHMYCLKPPMTAIPKNGWKCKNCRVCSDCGARTPGSGPSSRWHHNYSVCDSCYQQRNKGLCCPLCSKAYRHFDNKTMVLCNNCKKYVHSECDKTIDSEMLRRLKDGGQTDYICTVCREQGTEMDVGPFPLSSAEESVEGYPAVKDVEGFSEVSMGESTNLTMGSQESIYFEDSSSSMDVDYIPEKGLYGKDLYEGRMPSRAKFSGAGKKKFGAGRPRTRPLVEKRRTSLTFGEKRRGSKVKVKANPVAVAGQVKEVTAAAAAVPDSKEDSGDDHPSTIILSRSNDSYIHNHDICKACGSIGEESEKKLIVCVQCGQCYHPYCVTVKVTRVILQKGWRCLDCTVCEGCGSPDDEGRLLLCDDCDISYHIYCLDPPLEHVPKGTWKCKWCVYCVKCGTTTPGVGCNWQQNYTQCGPCASSVVCPSCKKNYREEELIIQCVHCDRWLHAGCDGICSEDDAERAADYGYHCLFCRPTTGQPGPLPPPPPPPPPQPVEESRPPSPPPVKEPEVPKQYLVDGVYLSASGLQHIQSLTVTMPKKPRQQRKNLKKMEKIDTLPKNPSVSRLMSLSSQEDESLDKDSDELKSMDITMETGDGVSQSSETPLPGATPAEGAAAMPVEEVVEEGGTKKRKQRRYVGLGVGGFIARHRARTNFLKRQMSLTSEMSQDGEPALLSSEGDKLSPHAIGEHAGAGEKLKKLRRKPKKSKLEEDFPTYLQEAFFGKSTLDLSRDKVPKKVLSSGSDSDDECSRPSSPQASAIEVDGEIAKSLQLAKDTAVPSTSMAGPPRTLTPSQVSTGRSEDFDDGDLSDFLVPESLNPDDDDIMQLLRSTDFDKDAELDIDETLGAHPKLDEDNSKDGMPDGLDQIMGPNFPIDQKMFPEDIDLGSIDMEMLKDVMANDAPPDQPSTSGEGQFGLSSMQGPGLPPMSRPLQSSPLGRSDSLPLPSIPGQPGQMGPMPPQDPMLPGHAHMGMQGPDGQGMPGPSGGMPPHYNMGPQTQFPQGFSHESPMPGSGQPPHWAGGAGMPSPTTAVDDEVRETSRRNILKWEADEALGANATISAVLYVNMNFPDLAKEYPDWSERSKQIAKLWKKLTPEEKNPYLAKARKNRTSSRVQKAQKQVAQEMRRRQEAQMRQDSQAMPPPPAPPPLTSPGQMGGGPDHGFMQASPEGMRPGMEGPMVSMLSPGSPMHSPGRPPLPGPVLEGSARTSPGQSPLQSPNQPGSSPYRMEDMQKPFDPLLQSPGGSRHPEGQMHGPHPFSPGAGNRTPEGASRQMADPYAFQSGDPFAQPPGRPQNRPPVSQPYDPYSQPPGTPRPGTHGEDEFGKPMHQPPFAGRPQQGQPGGDMFMPPPGAPRASGQIRHGSPMGMMGEGGPRMRPPINDPYAFQPSTPRPSTPQDDPYAQPPGTPRPVHDPMFRGMRPQFPRMGPPPTSDPYQGLPTSQHMDPYSQQPMTPRPGPHMPPSPDMSPNRPQMMSPNKPQMMGTGPSPPYGGGMDQFRHKLVRAQSMPDPYAQPPGTPRPGMDPHLSRSMSEEMGGRIRPHFMPEMGKPASSMTDPSMQTKLRMKKQQESEKMQAAGQQGSHPWPGPEAGPQGAMSPGAMPRMPGEGFPPRGMMEEGMRPGFPGPRPPGPGMGMPPRHLPPSMGGMQPGQPMGPRPGMAYPGQGSAGLPISQADHIPDLDRQRMRHMQMLRQGELSGAMGQPHMGGAGGPMPPSSVAGDQGYPGPHPQDPSLSMDMQERAIPVSAADPMAQRAALHRSDSQAPGPDDEVFRQTPLTSARDPMISDSKPSASESSDEQGLAAQGDADNLQLPDIDVHPKPSLSSEDDKHEDDDLLSADGTFDILKYADPELSHEDMEQDEKMILEHFDLIDQGDDKQRLKDDKEDTNDVDEAERSQDSSAAKSEAAMETDTSEDSKGASSKTSTSGFQSQFLEFNRKRLEMMDAEASEHSKERKEDKEAKDAKAGISHIAALLQGTDPMAARRMMGNKDDLAGEPSGGMMQRGHFQGQGMASPMHSGQSPHHGTPTPMQQSPGGGLHGQSSQSLPSPKVLPSPRSSQPSPHTPGIQSPFMGQGQGHSPHSQPVTPGQQLSPFSQSTSVQSPFSPPTSCGQSPFSSTSVSGPQSPFPRTQSPFTMTSQTGGSQVTFGSSPQHPGAHSTAPLYSKQSSGRGPNNPPPTPYMQPSYAQQLSLMQPKGQPATIGPLPSPMLYSATMPSQHGMRNPNAPFPGGRPPFPGPPGSQGQEMINQPRMPGMPGERPMGPRGMLPPVSIPGPGAHPPEKGLMSPSSVYPSLQQQLQQGPNFPGQPRMPPHSMGPRMMGPRPNYPPTSQQGYTLLDDLVEQEKQEQKRQAEQQAFLQRRDMAGKPDPNMAGGPRMGMHMPGMPPMGPRMDHPPRMPGPEGGWAPPTSQAGGPPPDMGGQFPPGFPGRPPSQQLSPRTPSPFQSSSPGMQPQVMSLGLLPPPPPPNPPPGEDGPEYHRQVLQYDEQLTKHGQFLEMQVKLLEQQISKQKRSKKTIQARQRQARKSGNELNSNDAAELERITQEQSAMQKQLEQHRKQFRQHQMTMQDYRSKHKERLSQSWPPGQPPVQAAAQQVGTQPDQPPGGVQPPPATSQAGSTPSQTTLVPRMPSSQGSARMSPSARQEYEAYMQNRLRMMNQALSQGPLIRPPRGPTTIIGDNNPFSEGYQEREQREKAQLSPSATPQPRMPMHFPGEPQKSPTIPPSPGKDGKGPGQMGPFFRDPGMSFEQGPRFRAPNPFPGEGGPRPEGQRLPSPGFSGSPGLFPGMPSPQMDPRMPFNQGAPFQGFGIPPANLPSEVGPAQEQKEKPKKRRKKKKNDESDNAHSQPLPPSMPNQGAPLGQQSSSTPTSTEGSAAPTKPPPELPKPQSETDRRILEILAKSQEQGGDPNKPAARSPRNKSPASTPGPPQGQGPTPAPQVGPSQGAQPGPGQQASQGMGQQPPGGQEGHGSGSPFPHTMGQGPGQHPGQGPSGTMPPVYGYGPGPGIIRPPPGGLDQSQMARARFPGMMPHGMHPGGPPLPPRMFPLTTGMHPQQGQHPLPPPAQGQPSQGAAPSVPSTSSVAPATAAETSTSTTASGSVDTSVASQNTAQAAEQAGSTHEQSAQDGRGGIKVESSQPVSQDPSAKEESAPGLGEPTKEAQQSQEKPQQEGPQQEKSGHTSVLQSYLSGSVPLPPTSHPKTMAEKLKTPAGKSQEQTSGAPSEEASGSVPAASKASTPGAPSSEAASGSDVTVATSSPQQPSAQQAAELAATTTGAPESITTIAPSAAATTSGSTTTSSVPTPGAAGRPMMQGPHPGAMPPYMCFPQRPPFSHLFQAGSLLPLSPHPQSGQSNPSAQAGPSPPSTQPSALVTSTASAPASQSPPVTVSSASAQSTVTTSSTAQSTSTATTAPQASEESKLASGQLSESEVQGGGQVPVSSQTGPSPPVSAAPGATPASSQTGAPTASQGFTPPCAPAGSVEQPSTTSVQTPSSGHPQGAVTSHHGSQLPATSQPGSQPKEGPPSSGADQQFHTPQPPSASSVPVSSQGEAGRSGPVASVVKPPQQYGQGKPGQMAHAPQHLSQASPVVSSHAQPGFSTAAHASQAGPMPPRYSAAASTPGHPQAGAGRMAPGQGHPQTPGHTQARMSPGYSQGGHSHSFSQAGPMPGHSQTGPMPVHSQAAPVPGHSQAGPMPGHSPTSAFPPGHSQASPVFPGHSQAGHMPPGFSQAGPVHSHEGPMASMHSQGSHMPPGYSQASGGPPGYPESGNMPPSHSQAGSFPPGHPQSGQMHPGHIRPGHPHAMHTGQMHPRFSQQGPMPPGFSQAGAMPPGYSQSVPFHHGHPQPGHMASGPSGGPRPRMPQGGPLSPMNMPPGMMQRMPPHHINVQPSSQMGHFMGERRMPTPDQMSMHSQRMSPRMPGMAGPGAHPPASMGHPGYPGQQPMHTGQSGMGPRPGMPHHPMGPVPPGSRPMGHRFPPHSGVNPLLDPHGPGPRPGLGSQASLMLPPTSSFAQSSAATPLASMSGMVTSVPASPTPPHTPVSSTPPQPLHHLPISTAAASLPGTSPTFSLAGIEGLVKEEPQEKQGMECGERRQDHDEQRMGQNALLKQLLANSNIQKNKAEGAEDSEDSLPQLTPEQQKQLEIIDKMPLCKETEISHEEWESKTPDEREQILDQNGKGGVSPSNFPNEQSSGQSHSPTQMRRQEYERRRKEYEEARKNRKKGSGILGAGEPKQPTKRKKMKEGHLPVKKRSRKLKAGEPEVEAQVEAIFQQLRAMSPVVLKEPDIAPNYNIVPIYGFSVSNNDQPRYQLMPERGLPGLQPPLLSPPGLGPPALSSGPHLTPSPHLPKPRIGPRPAESVKSDSPATVISSSSPECSFNDMDESFPALRLIEPAESPQEVAGKMSPTVPIVHPVPIKPDAPQVKEEVDADAMEGKLGLLSPKRDVMGDLEALVSNAGKRDVSCKTHALTSSLAQTFRETMDQQVSVTLTLNASAAEDLGGVISAIADLLKIAVPPTYELIRSPSPEMFKLNMTHKEEAVNIQSLMKAKPKYCKHCDVVVLSSGIKRKREELPSHLRDSQVWEEEVTFCSMNCCMQFMVSQRSQPPVDSGKDVAASLGEHKSGATDSTPSASPRTSSVASTPPPTTPVSTPLAIIPPSTASSSSTLSPILPSPPVKVEKEKAGKKHRRSSSTTEPQTPKPLVKKWKDTRWKRWDPLIADQPKVSPKSEKGVEELWGNIKTIVAKEGVDDTRSCGFCHEVGDGAADGPSRLLNMDVDKYAHLNCALWSSEVYETLNGALIHVDQAHRRSLTLECVWCHKKGASMSCFRLRCGNSYHLPCAQRAGCKFFHDKTILCPNHITKVVFSEENVIPSLVVHRRVYISRDEDRQVAHMIHQGEGYYLRVGSLTLIQIGQLLPHQIQTGKFHSREYIYPVGFKTSRLYWSMRFLFQRCKYICTIEEKDGRPVFTVEVKEQGYPDVRFQEKTPKECWMHAFEPIEKMRREADLVKMFPSFITGEDFFGLTEPSIVKVLESLPGTDLLQNYNFRFGRSPLIEMPLAINPTGCARAEPKFRTHFRKPHTLQTSTSRSLPSTVTGVTGDINSPYMKQFVHSKSQQYRRLKTEWKANVFLGRSRIQGLGLFAAKDLEKHTMVIEYIGDLIRNEVANKKEKIYENQNRGVYMFRIDQDTVIDATMAGGPARYINHSCAPNCVAEVVPFERESKIIIITNRRIAKGEELTYDYKFDFEDDQHKIPCCCGASVCRKWMN